MAVSWSLETHETLDSTQARAKELAAQSAQEGTCVQALAQNSGHGRHGREWVSPRGNLYLSFILRPKCEIRDMPQLSLVTALALAAVINHDDLTLKWPNDILIGGKKCAGILLEREGDALIVGVGVNTKSAPEGAACVDVKRDQFLDQFDIFYQSCLAGGFAKIRAQWLEKSYAPGTKMSVKNGSHIIQGAFIGLDSTGNLLLEREGEIKIISAGEIHCC